MRDYKKVIIFLLALAGICLLLTSCISFWGARLNRVIINYEDCDEEEKQNPKAIPPEKDFEIEYNIKRS
jgi:hypothetical protein